MQRTYLQRLKDYIGKEVKVAAWVHVKRDHGSIVFLTLRDSSGFGQAIVTKDNERVFNQVKSLTAESVVEIIGVVQEAPQVADGGVEVVISEQKVLSVADANLPIPVLSRGMNESDREVRLDHRWIDLRKPEKLLIFKVWTTLEEAFREYWINNGYIQIYSPKLMSSPSESKSELFELPYFGKTAYLAQSPQFYKQMAMASGFEKIFEIGPVFRANPSFTSRHDTEFTGYDMEISFIESHQDVIRAEEEVLSFALKAVEKNHAAEIEKEYGRKFVAPVVPFPQVTMAEAKQILASLHVENERDGDLSPEEERKLSEYMKEKTNHEFLFVTEYPAEVRAFYHMRVPEKPHLTKSFDLLWNGIEITTGAQREHQYEKLRQQAVERYSDVSSLDHYLNFFKYGCPPHGGLGLSPTRMLTRLFGINNVREVTYLYRGPNRLTP